jgi:hypothetical protein
MISGSTGNYKGYRCRNLLSAECRGRYVSERYVEKMVRQALHQVFSCCAGEIGAKFKPFRDRVAARRRQLEDQLNRAKVLFLQQEFETLEDYNEFVAPLKQELESLQDVSTLPISASDVTKWAKQIDTEWTDLSREVKRQIITAIGARITVNTGNRPLWIELTSILNPDPVKVKLYHTHRNRRNRSASDIAKRMLLFEEAKY